VPPPGGFIPLEARLRYASIGVLTEFELRLLGEYLVRIGKAVELAEKETEEEFANFRLRLDRIRDRAANDALETEADDLFSDEKLRKHDLESTARYEMGRLLLGSYLLSVWAVWESGVIECVNSLARRRDPPADYRAFRARDTLSRLGGFLQSVCGIDLTYDSSELLILRRLMTVRHAYAHAHGILAHISRRHRAELEGWFRDPSSGITAFRGRVAIDMRFARDAHTVTQQTLTRLVVIARSGFRPPPG
jgi:hypothetical protein